MVMVPAVLANSLASNPNVKNEAEAISNFTDSWITYFSTATAGIFPIIVPYLDTLPRSSMISAMTGLSTDGATAIQSGILAFWVALGDAPIAVFPACTVITPPPTIGNISTLLLPVFQANIQLELTAQECYINIANVLNGVNIAGGIATILVASVPTPFPIL